MVNTWIFKSNGIQHTHRRLCNANAVIAAAGLSCRSLDHDAAKARKLNEIRKFLAITKGTRGCQNW